jgi:hypothetical protein
LSFCQLSLFAVVFSWGEVIKTDINKEEVHNVIKKYVDEKYPQRVTLYHEELKQSKKAQIAKIKERIFIHNTLMWQDENINNEKKLNRLKLKRYCQKLDLANRKDWRVPQYAELVSLINYETINPAAIDTIKYIKSVKYWSSSKSVLEKDKNWFVDFQYGTSDISSDLVRYNIRCVRTMSKKQGSY